jgi:3-oxoacyl-[acyl-carrier protein] reductase
MHDPARPLDGISALVIGGGGAGIGRSISRAFSAAGAAVAIADIDPQRARDAAGELTELGAHAVPLSGDVRSGSAVDGFVTSAAAEFGRLDTLVTVVGGQVAFVPAVRLHEMSDDDWDLAFDMNLRHVARAARAAIRAFLAQGTGGSIVSVGSVTGIMAAPRQAGYGAAKAGLASLAKTVAAEYAGDGIRMNIVACGAIGVHRGHRSNPGRTPGLIASARRSEGLDVRAELGQRGDPLRLLVRAFVGAIKVDGAQPGFSGREHVQVVQVPDVQDVPR